MINLVFNLYNILPMKRVLTEFMFIEYSDGSSQERTLRKPFAGPITTQQILHKYALDLRINK